MDLTIEIIHEDPCFVVVKKPSGLLSVPGRGLDMQNCVVNQLKALYPDCMEQPSVHRLDMDTSGLIIMAKNKAARRHLSIEFQERKVEKTYIARVFGALIENEGLIDLPLICDWPNRPKQIVDFEVGKPSQTKWQVLKRQDSETRLLLTPITGRSHQLRVHLQNIDHPILGDRFYAHDQALNMSNRLCLHSKRLTITHPVTLTKVTFECEEPF